MVFWNTKGYDHKLRIVYKSGNVEVVRCNGWEVTKDDQSNISRLVITDSDRGAQVYWGLNNIESIWEV
jgi:hypothetical protein